MDFHFASRMDQFQPGIFNVLDEKKKDLEAAGKKVWNLSIGTPDFQPDQHVMQTVSEAAKNPENYKNRVCVAYDRRGNAKPYMYVLVGNHDHSNEHDIRKIYSKTTGTNYYDTRIILYSTYVKRALNVKNNIKD